MRFSVLGSGSRGNAVYIESGQTAILIDAGFSGKQIDERLKMVGRNVDLVNAVFLTHEHNDHILGAGVISRGCRVAVYANDGTLSGGEKKLGRPHAKKEFATGDTVIFQDLEIRSFRISHDTKDPVGYVIGNGKNTIGYCTDTGKVSHLMSQRLRDCDALILEFNHDPTMLKEGPYPLALQQRVRSNQGHLANEAAACFLKEIAQERLQYVVLAHLSETNNLPRLAMEAASRTGVLEGKTIVAAHQHLPLPLLELGGGRTSG